LQLRITAARQSNDGD